MLTNAAHLKGLVIQATDGEIGTVDQFYFDDESMGHPLPHGRNRRLAWRPAKC